MQKELSFNEISKLSLEKAWEVSGDYATYLENGGGEAYSYTDRLPWKRDDILISLLKILESYPDNRELIKTICTNIVILVSFHIPTEKEYKDLTGLKQQMDAHRANTR